MTGLDRLRIAVVLGHPDDYPRFGFEPAIRHKIRWEHEAPEEAFMVLSLVEDALEKVGGMVRYRPEFNGL